MSDFIQYRDNTPPAPLSFLRRNLYTNGNFTEISPE